MALDKRNFDPTGSGSKGGFKMGTYDAGADNAATVQTDGYFDDAELASVMNTGDILLVSASDATKFYILTVTKATNDIALSTGTAVA